MNGIWVDLDVRDEIIQYTEKLIKTDIFSLKEVLKLVGIKKTKYYQWQYRTGKENSHNSIIPKRNWTLPQEKSAVINYVKQNYPVNSMFLKEGYRRITYQMLDEDIVALKPSTVYRILKAAGLLNQWNTHKKAGKGLGFKQPDKPHKDWHTDIKYVNHMGTFLFLITVMDGYSRYILHHELRLNMTEYDVELTIQKAREKYPEESPNLISDNGPQYKAKEFAKYLKEIGLQHIKTSVGYPQSNGKMERFYRTLGEECLNTNSMLNLEDARRTIAGFINYYNTQRLHSSIFYLTPEDFLMGRAEKRIKEREQKFQTAIEVRNNYWLSSKAV